MASKESPSSSRFKLTFPEKILGEPIVHKLSKEHDIVPNILRGRITQKSAWLEVELVGSRKNIDKALRYLEDRGVTVLPLES